MVQEKRKDLRIDFHLKAIIKQGSGLAQTPGKIMNFSTEGAFIHTPSPSQFKRGDVIELIIKLPLEGKATRIKAHIAHVTRKGIGVKFKDLSHNDVMDIKYCFDVFKNTLPLPGT